MVALLLHLATTIQYQVYVILTVLEQKKDKPNCSPTLYLCHHLPGVAEKRNRKKCKSNSACIRSKDNIVLGMSR